MNHGHPKSAVVHASCRRLTNHYHPEPAIVDAPRTFTLGYPIFPYFSKKFTCPTVGNEPKRTASTAEPLSRAAIANTAGRRILNRKKASGNCSTTFLMI